MNASGRWLGHVGEADEVLHSDRFELQHGLLQRRFQYLRLAVLRQLGEKSCGEEAVAVARSRTPSPSRPLLCRGLRNPLNFETAQRQLIVINFLFASATIDDVANIGDCQACFRDIRRQHNQSLLIAVLVFIMILKNLILLVWAQLGVKWQDQDLGRRHLLPTLALIYINILHEVLLILIIILFNLQMLLFAILKVILKCHFEPPLQILDFLLTREKYEDASVR